MKKPIKIMLLVLAVLTVITEVAAVVMLKAASGDKLFYMAAVPGRIIAVSYRWVCLAGIVLFLFWILFALRKWMVSRSKRAKQNAADKAEALAPGSLGKGEGEEHEKTL